MPKVEYVTFSFDTYDLLKMQRLGVRIELQNNVSIARFNPKTGWTKDGVPTCAHAGELTDCVWHIFKPKTLFEHLGWDNPSGRDL